MRSSFKITTTIIAILTVFLLEEIVRANYEQPIAFAIDDTIDQEDAIGDAWGWFARGVLLTLRPTKSDIQYMNADAGARYIARLDDEDFARKLLDRSIERGLNLESLDRSGQWTALQSAAIEGDLRAVKLLLAVGAQVKKNDAKGRPLLDLLNRIALNEPDKEYVEIIKTLQL